MPGCRHQVKSKQTNGIATSPAVLYLQDFCSIPSAETLYDYHNVPLKHASNMMTTTRRNYIQCLSTSVMCNMQACDIFRKRSERMANSQSVLIIYSFYVACSTQNAI